MDIGRPQRVRVVEPLEDPVPRESPAPAAPVPASPEPAPEPVGVP